MPTPANAQPSLAEQRAAAENLPVVTMIGMELLSVFQGQPVIVRALNGQEMLVRLPTADELLKQNADARVYARDVLGVPIDESTPPMTRAQAIELSTPLSR